MGLVLSLSLILTFAALVLLRAGAPADPLQPISIATGEWAPYSGEGLPEFGIAAAVVARVLQKMGYQPQFHFLPWERAEASALDNEGRGGVRGAFPYGKVASRQAQFYYSEPLLEIGFSVFYHRRYQDRLAGHPQLKTLTGFAIVPIKGYRYPEAAERLLAAGMAPASSNREALARLIDSPAPLLVLEATTVGASLLQALPPGEAAQIDSMPLALTSPLHFIASRRNPGNRELIARFDATLAAMRADGSLEAVRRRVEEALDARRTVRLEPFAADRAIAAFRAWPGGASLLLPRGSRAVVEQWGSAYLLASVGDTPGARMVRVRLLNGPLKGERFYVDGRNLVLP